MKMSELTDAMAEVLADLELDQKPHFLFATDKLHATTFSLDELKAFVKRREAEVPYDNDGLEIDITHEDAA